MNFFKLICLIAFVANPVQSGEGAIHADNLISSCEPAGAGVSGNGISAALKVRVMDEELDRFKRYDLRLYAATLGFVIDRRESSRGSTVMRRDSEKLIISRKPDGHYTFWSPHDDTDRGTIIDFVQRRKGLTLGAVRKELREWMNIPPSIASQLPELTTQGKDVDTVRKRYAAMAIAERHSYLENERCIPEEILTHARFAGTISIDRLGAAVFPHRDENGNICGYEIKNSGFTGFASGGRKQIWLSNVSADDLRFVICESAIDALSHAALFDDPRARYGSIGGKTTAAQHETIRAAILAMPANTEIVAATDADDSGRKLADLIQTIVEECGRDDLSFRRDAPTSAKDWNDVLRAMRRTVPIARRPGEPSVA